MPQAMQHLSLSAKDQVGQDSSEAFTISGCLVKWREEGEVYNSGYIEHWAQKKLGSLGHVY